ncbi:unnamed protein product [Auanema sp. JU1783]|nr:unnamed protein product [Auanema sp. JU1783]
MLKVNKLNRTKAKLAVTKPFTTTTAEPVPEVHHRRIGRTRRLKLVPLNGSAVRVPSRVHQNPETTTVTPTTVPKTVLVTPSEKTNDQEILLEATAEALQKSSKFVSGHARAGKKHSNVVIVDEVAKKTVTISPFRRRLRHSGISHSKIHRISA